MAFAFPLLAVELVDVVAPYGLKRTDEDAGAAVDAVVEVDVDAVTAGSGRTVDTDAGESGGGESS